MPGNLPQMHVYAHINPNNGRVSLSLAEHWYNTNYHSSLKMSPFQALYGYPPPQLAINDASRSANERSESWIHNRIHMLSILKDNLGQAQQRMKHYADKNRSERSFVIGDWVYLKLQPYRQISVAIRKCVKLSSKFFRPYEVLEKIGQVAYRLRLPAGALIHPVFHVSQLKRRVSHGRSVQLEPPLVGPDGQPLTEHVAILGRRILKRNNAALVEVLVQWANLSPEEATWEEYHHLMSQFPSFKP
ncbi:PREDICTED: uncharacterized protein LOC109169119 [Ipomoea nil]|uniref:uncharacterized protein LOC109169119 n=1 Tax=Ipomoea nil TaxID=35883 RepID=UPI00090151E4|nr:PREDICTED: uncharacterized protein LOC109169119 [Ipomoea nil]